MKICRFLINNEVRTGIVEGDSINVCDENFEPVGELFDLASVKLLTPVSPSKIVCVGRNYAEHAKELGNSVPIEPLLFLKAPSAITRSGDPIVIPSQSEQVEHEGELAVVIKMACKDLVDGDDILKYILGYTCLNDVTARDVQRRDVQFSRGKSFDTFCPIGPFIETDLDVSDVRVATSVNGEIRQDGRTSQMVFPVDFLVRYISRQMTLVPAM